MSGYSSMTRNRAGSSAARIAIGSAVGQGIALALLPAVSRIYSPSDLGIFATCMALATIFGAVATLRIDRALALPNDEREAAVFAYGGIIAAIALPLAGMAAYLAALLLMRVEAPSLWWTVAPLASAIGCGTLLLQYAIRRRNYRSVALRNAIQPTVQALTQVGLGFAVGGYGVVLVLAAIVGRLAGLSSLFRQIHTAKEGMGFPEARHIFASLLRRYHRVVYLGTLAGLVNTAALQAAVPLVAFVYGPHSAGLFSMSQMLFISPFVLLGGAVGQVFLGEFSFAVRRGDPTARELFGRASRALSAMAVTAGVTVALLAPAIPAALGERWAASGHFGLLLVPLVATRLLSTPLAQTLIVLERQGTQLALDSVRIVGIFTIFFWAGAEDLGLNATILSYSVWCSMTYLIQWNLCRRALTFLPTPH